MFNYQEFLDSIDRKAYHEGEVVWEEDGYTVTRTYNYTGPGCHDSCGVLLYVKDGKLERVEGDPLDPVTNGKLCIRCLDLPEMTNNERRLKYPMKRDKSKRGDADAWERISWDEALDIIEDYIKTEIDEKGLGRESILVGHGTGRNINWQVPFIAGACLRTANVGGIYFSGWWCYMPRVCGAAGPLGDYPIVDASETLPDRYANPEWKAPDVLVVWGNEPLKSNADGYIGHWLNLCVQMGTKIISIDPVLTWWGARADYWLRPKPGTDCALSLAWLNVIINEDLIDHEFVEYWCAYYDELKEHVQQFTPEWAADITGVPVEDIVGSARLYAQAQRGAIQWGLVFDAGTSSSMSWTHAVCDLMAICGNIDRPGTHVLVHNAFDINAGYSSVDLYADKGALERKFRKWMIDYPGFDFVGMSNADAMAAVLEAGKIPANDEEYPTKMLWAQSCNAFSGHEGQVPRAYKTMNKFDFIVYADPMMTPTMNAIADLVLPVSMSVERDSARTWWTPLRSMKKCTSYYEAKSDEEIALWLGKRLNPELFQRWDTVEDFINDYLLTDLAVVNEDGSVTKANFSAGTDEAWGHSSVADGEVSISTKCPYTFDQLTNDPEVHGVAFDEWNATYCKYEKGLLRADGQVGFNTPSGRIELIPSIFRDWGVPEYPVYTPAPETWQETPDIMEQEPFYLISGSRSYEFFHTEHRMAQTMRELHPEPRVKISPRAAAKYGIKDGEWIWIENSEGRFTQQAEIFEGIPDDCLSAEHGWWKPENEDSAPVLNDCFTYNPNNCTRNFQAGPGDIGSPIKCVRVHIYKRDKEHEEIMPGEQVCKLGGYRNDYVPMEAVSDDYVRNYQTTRAYLKTDLSEEEKKKIGFAG